MRVHYPKVLAANRFFEEETEIHNEVGTNNLNDALSHLGTLFERAETMDYTQQATELHDFEGHLRRSMMESYEQIFRLRMGDVAKLWEKHDKIARPLQAKDKLHGVTSLEELQKLRRQCKLLLDKGRAAKRGHDWEEWDAGTESLAEACRKATDLKIALDAGIAAAEGVKRQKSGVRIGAVTALVCLLLATPLAYFFTEVLFSESVTVPDVRGQRITPAVIAIANARLDVETQPPSARSSRCRVQESAPRPGREVDEGTTVTLVVSCAGR